MGRWEPDAVGRFRTAAMTLFVERGYDDTTVADIAREAGLTSRTFFRYFADKREVLFDGSQRLQSSMVDALKAAPPEATAIEAVAAALHATAAFFDGNRGFARQRRTIIEGHADLRERELIKLATMSSALAEALRARGVREPDASLAGEAGIAVFRVAWSAWVDEEGERGFGDVVDEALKRFSALLR